MTSNSSDKSSIATKSPNKKQFYKNGVKLYKSVRNSPILVKITPDSTSNTSKSFVDTPTTSKSPNKKQFFKKGAKFLKLVKNKFNASSPILVQITPDSNPTTSKSLDTPTISKSLGDTQTILKSLDDTPSTSKSPNKKQFYKKGVNLLKSFGNKFNVMKQNNKNPNHDELLQIPPRSDIDIQRSEQIFKNALNDAMLILESLASYEPISVFRATQIFQELLNERAKLFDY